MQRQKNLVKRNFDLENAWFYARWYNNGVDDAEQLKQCEDSSRLFVPIWPGFCRGEMYRMNDKDSKVDAKLAP